MKATEVRDLRLTDQSKFSGRKASEGVNPYKSDNVCMVLDDTVSSFRLSPGSVAGPCPPDVRIEVYFINLGSARQRHSAN